MKQLLETLISPLGLVNLLFVFGLILRLLRQKSKLGYELITVGATLYLVFLFSPLAEILIRNLEANYAPLLRPDSSLGIERVVILAGYGETHSSIPVTSTVSAQTLCSMAEGIRLYHQFPGAKVILSGGVLREGDKSVAGIMADFIQAMGVQEQDILVEGQSQNTYENLVYVKPMVSTKPFVLVAAACDLPRAMAVAHKLGMYPVAAPACIWALQHYASGMSLYSLLGAFPTPSLERLPRLQWAFHEYVGYWWYKLLGRV